MSSRVVTVSVCAAMVAALASAVLVLSCSGRERGSADRSAAELAALRGALSETRAEVAALRAAQATPPAVEPAAVIEPPPYDDEPAPVAQRAARAPEAPASAAAATTGDDEAAYQAEVARAEQRFTMLSERLQQQGRVDDWAVAREREIVALKTGHEYFASTTFETVECRATWCRVVAAFAEEADKETFETAFPGFLPQFPHASMRTLGDEVPLRTEVFLSTNGALPH